jgi:putative polyketide hydroxylase
MNVGTQDAHNLAWNLAAGLKGWAEPPLLASYESERMPVSRAIMEHSARNAGLMDGRHAGSANSSPRAAPVQSSLRLPRPPEHGLIFGTTYDSAIIMPDRRAPIRVENPVTDYVPNARPGRRALHVWLERAGERISSLDLFGQEFVLLAGSNGQSWCDAATEMSRLCGIPVRTFRVGVDGELNGPRRQWATTYGVEDDGAVLVKPDGYVARRSPSMSSHMRRAKNHAISAAIGKQSR